MSGFSFYLPPIVTVVAVALLAVVAIRLYIFRRRSAREIDELRQSMSQLEAGKQERLKTADALHRKQAWYRILFNNTNGMIFVHGITEDGLPAPGLTTHASTCWISPPWTSKWWIRLMPFRATRVPSS